MRPDMVYVWALALLARGCCVLGSRQHATRLYQALLPFAGRAAVGAGAVMCAGSASRYLGGLAALSGQTAAAEEHFKVAIAHHRLLGAKPLLARSLHEYAQLLAARAAGPDLARAAEALGEARAIAAECSMTKLTAILNEQQAATAGAVTMEREGDYWAVRHAGSVARLPDSVGLRYLDLLIRNPGRELAALDITQLASATPASTTPAGIAPPGPAQHPVTGAAADDVLDARALAEYRRRLAELDADLAEAEQWNDTERASRARTERDFLLRELASATGIHGRPRRLGSESERARVNVTRSIRSAINRIRTHNPAPPRISIRPSRPAATARTHRRNSGDEGRRSFGQPLVGPVAGGEPSGGEGPGAHVERAGQRQVLVLRPAGHRRDHLPADRWRRSVADRYQCGAS